MPKIDVSRCVFWGLWKLCCQSLLLKYFYLTDHLKPNEKTQKGIKDYKCITCQKRFSHTYGLIHTGLKWFFVDLFWNPCNHRITMKLFTKYFVNIRMNNKLKASRERGSKEPLSRGTWYGAKGPLPALCNSEKEGSHRLPKPSCIVNLQCWMQFLTIFSVCKLFVKQSRK